MTDSAASANRPTGVYQNLAGRISTALPRLGSLPCVLGFDGTVDVISKPVQSREGPGPAYTAFPHIRDLGRRIVAADGKSAIIEIVEEQEKIGGNGPIMANALASTGLPVDYIGSLGLPELHPAYHGLAEKIGVHSIAQPAITRALEFENGKIMLATISSYEHIHPDQIRETLGPDRTCELVSASRLCCLLNWTCLPRMNEIFDWFLDDILPGVPSPDGGGKRLFFFDLADPSMRNTADLRGALEQISRFEKFGHSILGMNLNEVQQVCGALGISAPSTDPESVRTTLETIRRSLGIRATMGHPVDFAACATEDGSWAVAGPYTGKPRITTGAGDHLNAGFCLGMLLDFPVPEALALGALFSGFYVRTGKSPSLDELPGFISQLNNQPESNPKAS